MANGKSWRVALFVFFCVSALARHAHAQSALTGCGQGHNRRRAAGVTVEASSAVLIEKSKSAITDALVQYRIVDLRPGTYVVVFTLPGFSSVRREERRAACDFTCGGERRPEGRLRRGNGHRERSVAGGRRSERARRRC
jgi:hypothetical protein